MKYWNEEYMDRIQALYTSFYKLNESQIYLNFDYSKETPKTLDELEYKLDDLMNTFNKFVKEVGTYSDRVK